MNKERQKFHLASLLQGFSDISFLFLFFGIFPSKKRKSLPVLVFLRMSLLRWRTVAFILSSWSLFAPYPLYKRIHAHFQISFGNPKNCTLRSDIVFFFLGCCCCSYLHPVAEVFPFSFFPSPLHFLLSLVNIDFILYVLSIAVWLIGDVFLFRPLFPTLFS